MLKLFMKYKLLFIFLLALFVRLVFINKLPLGFTPDEASFGYDAYSIIKTGKDQWGNFLPLNFKSFGDDKLPLYTYITLPFVYFFGLNEISVRLPNILLSSFSVLVLFFLTKEMFNKKVGFWAAFFLAISPWHIQLSRGAFEANLTNFFMPLALYFYFIFVKKKNIIFFLVFVFLLLINSFSYHSARLLSFLILPLLLLYSFKDFKIVFLRYKFLVSIVLFLFFFINFYFLFFVNSGRIGTSTIFSNDLYNFVFEKRFVIHKIGVNEWFLKIFHNKFISIVKTFTENYFSYFSFPFLFFQGAREATYGMVKDIGVIYFVDIFLLVSCILFYSKVNNKKNLYLLIILMLLAPIPAAISVGPGHAANRAAIMIPFLMMILAIGLDLLINNLKLKKGSEIVVLFIYLVSFAFFLEKYYFLQRVFNSNEMLYGTKDLFNHLSKYDNKTIYISKNISEPHIYFAFYNKYDPYKYQKQVSNWQFDKNKYTWVDQIPEYKIENYVFTSTPFKDLKLGDSAVLVGKPQDFRNIIYNENSVKSIKNLQDEDVYWILNYEK